MTDHVYTCIEGGDGDPISETDPGETIDVRKWCAENAPEMVEEAAE